jgi:hypothetical protein
VTVAREGPLWGHAFHRSPKTCITRVSKPRSAVPGSNAKLFSERFACIAARVVSHFWGAVLGPPARPRCPLSRRPDKNYTKKSGKLLGEFFVFFEGPVVPKPRTRRTLGTASPLRRRIRRIPKPFFEVFVCLDCRASGLVDIGATQNITCWRCVRVRPEVGCRTIGMDSQWN